MFWILTSCIEQSVSERTVLLTALVAHLEALVHHQDCFIEFFNVGNDSGK